MFNKHNNYYDNSRYGISYYDYGISLLNRRSNEFFMDGKLTLEANYTLERIVNALVVELLDENGEGIGYNILGLPMDLVSWFPEEADKPVNYTQDIYRAFITRFFNRQINQQTFDMHKLKLQQFFMARKQALIMQYRAYTQVTLKNVNNKNDNADGGVTVTTTSAMANSTVPENEVDIDVKNTKLTYADDLARSVQEVSTRNDGNNTSTNTTSAEKDLKDYINLDGELEKLFDSAEKEQLFMQV